MARGEFVNRGADVLVRVAGFGDGPRNASWDLVVDETTGRDAGGEEHRGQDPRTDPCRRLGRMAAAAARSPLRRMLGQRVRHSNAR